MWIYIYKCCSWLIVSGFSWKKCWSPEDFYNYFYIKSTGTDSKFFCKLNIDARFPFIFNNYLTCINSGWEVVRHQEAAGCCEDCVQSHQQPLQGCHQGISKKELDFESIRFIERQKYLTWKKSIGISYKVRHFMLLVSV